MNTKTSITFKLDKYFRLSVGQRASSQNCDLSIHLIRLTREYAGHRSEEAGEEFTFDEFQASLQVARGSRIQVLNLRWRENDAEVGYIIRSGEYTLRCLDYGESWIGFLAA